MEVVVLASGSSGNAAVVSSGGTSVLIDAGISAGAIRRRMESAGFSVDELAAVVLTHEHVDHVRGLRVLLRRRPLPVWASGGTWSALDVRSGAGGELVSGRTTRIGGLWLTPVATSHDAREPVAIVVEDGRHRVALCTDTGTGTPLLAERLVGCQALLMETNHDGDLLRTGPYPWPLKQRIASRRGHLANHQATELIDRLRGPDLSGVVGMHVSEENNLPDLVAAAVGEGAPGVPVAVAGRHRMVHLTLAGGRLTMVEADAPPTRRRRETA